MNDSVPQGIQPNSQSQPGPQSVVDPLAPAQQPVQVPIVQSVEGTQSVPTQAAESTPAYSNQQPSKTPVLPEIKAGPTGPSFYGYKPPKWANDFEYVRLHKGKGKDNESDTWLLYLVDRLLKMHS